MKIGKDLNVVPLAQEQQWTRLKTPKLYTGLTTIDVGVSSDGSERAVADCTAMMGMGSLYTIANSSAVKSYSELTRSGSDSIGSLRDSNVICAGIDGRPMPLKTLPISTVLVGGSTTTDNIEIDVRGNGVFAADVPGLQAVGLGHRYLH